jgi:hypothetical protein
MPKLYDYCKYNSVQNMNVQFLKQNGVQVLHYALLLGYNICYNFEGLLLF